MGVIIMPKETKEAVEATLGYCEVIEGFDYCVIDDGKLNSHLLVSVVRDYFNKNDIEYSTFSFKDLKEFIPIEYLSNNYPN